MPKVVVIEGEDAAPEAMRPTIALLDRLGLDLEWVHPPIDDRVATRRAIDDSATALFGATSGPSAWALFYLRWGKGTYANVRPTRWQPGFRSVLARPQGIDLVIVRENLEDLYVGVEGDLEALRPACLESPTLRRPVADLGPGRFALKVITEAGATTRRALRLRARATAEGRGPSGHRHLRHQAQHAAAERRAVPLGGARRRAAATRTSASTASWSTTSPAGSSPSRTRLDVVVLPNLYGDILSDAAAGLVGGLGLAPSGCYGDGYAYFESVHGTAPDIAGRNVINPTATILSAVMMLDHLGFDAAARRLDAAVARVYAAGAPLTPDQGGAATTTAFCEAVAEHL